MATEGSSGTSTPAPTGGTGETCKDPTAAYVTLQCFNAYDVAVTENDYATQTMLQAAGIDVALDTTKDTAGHIGTITVQKDFDISGWGLAISSDDGAMPALAQNLASTSASNRVGYKSPTVDQALKDLRAASNDDDKKAAFKTIAEEVAKDLPLLPFAAIEELIVWQDDVHGLVFNHSTSVHLDNAWIG